VFIFQLIWGEVKIRLAVELINHFVVLLFRDLGVKLFYGLDPTDHFVVILFYYLNLTNCLVVVDPANSLSVLLFMVWIIHLIFVVFYEVDRLMRSISRVDRTPTGIDWHCSIMSDASNQYGERSDPFVACSDLSCTYEKIDLFHTHRCHLPINLGRG
jgi:hypothetical protein